MRRRYLVPVLALFGPFLSLRADEQELIKSPQGNFVIVQGDHGQDWVVSASNSSKREKLGPPSELGSGAYSVSPDEQWIISQIHIGSGMSGAALFHRKEGLRFMPFTGDAGRIDELLWKFHEHAIGLGKGKAEDEELNMVDFIGFSPDSSRILLLLRGGEKHGEGYYGWLVYFNTHTSRLEQTPYLKAKSRGSEKRWTDDDLRDQWAPPASAEPIGALPDEAQLKSRWQEADQKLNAVYTKLRARWKKDEKELRQKQQQEWLVLRDAGAAEYAKAGEPSTQAQRRWQYLGDVTEIRVQELTAELSN